MKLYRILLAWLISITGSAMAQTPPEKSPDRAAKWEKEIAAIEKRQTEKPPEKGSIVFAGSSSIRLWDLPKSFPDWKVVNSGFGGSEIRDSTIFADRIILKHEPKTIVFYAGDNDLAAGRTPEQVLEDFTAFTKAIHAKLPKTQMLFIPIKPSIARWKLYESQKKANQLVREFISKDSRLTYIDIVPAMLGDDGKPKAEYLQKDGLHMTPAGYAIWNDAVKKALKKGN